MLPFIEQMKDGRDRFPAASSIIDTATGNILLEETALTADIRDADVDNEELKAIDTAARRRSKQSIIDVAMQHASDPESSVERRMGIVPPEEHIVIDLRSSAVTEESDPQLELHLIRELPPALDLTALEPFTDYRPDRPHLGDGDELTAEDVSNRAEYGTTLRHAVPPVRGLAAASWPARAAKRALDIVLSLTALILLSPVFLVVTILVKSTSAGPVFYRSVRTGKNGKEFRFLKFRSMYQGAAKDLAKVACDNEQSGPIFKIKRDPRITSIGRVLRRSSLDELPQLVHVLTGSMSMVGPRPALPDEVAQYDARARQRLAVKPGITCIWQVSGRSDLDFSTWIDMDIDYIRGWSLLLDLRLLLLTIPAVLSGKGAY